MQWRPFEYDNEVYALDHLDSFEWKYTTEAGPKRPAREYKFHVTFSMHCFTRDPQQTEVINNDLWYEGPKENRLFCFDRYPLTHQLSDIVKGLATRPCWVTKHGNFFTIELIADNGEKIEYEVYFDVTKATRKGWLNLVVQSAYVRTAGYQSQRPIKRKIRLSVIAYNRLLGKPIKPGA